MAITSTPIDVHWNYFLSVESDLIQLSRYIEFHEQNFECFSLENTRILLAASAETDVICKQICKSINSSSSADKINKYRDEITQKFPNFSGFQVLAPRYGITLIPWSNWAASDGVPDWWTAYNKVKHHRHTDFFKANLKNVLNAVAGLYVACLYLYKDKAEMGQLRPFSSILKPTDDRVHDRFIPTEGGKFIL